jgi:Anti-sigma factor NepR
MVNSNEAKGKGVKHVDTAFDPVAAALRQLHESVAQETLPDDFLRILEEIDAKIAAAKPSQ